MKDVKSPVEFPEYQATYMKGEVNFCVRKDTPDEAVDGLKDMIKNWQDWTGSQGEESSKKPAVTTEIDHVCPDCGGELEFKKGYNVEKDKHWQGIFCQNKSCKHVEWK